MAGGFPLFSLYVHSNRAQYPLIASQNYYSLLPFSLFLSPRRRRERLLPIWISGELGEGGTVSECRRRIAIAGWRERERDQKTRLNLWSRGQDALCHNFNLLCSNLYRRRAAALAPSRQRTVLWTPLSRLPLPTIS